MKTIPKTCLKKTKRRVRVENWMVLRTIWRLCLQTSGVFQAR